jgi:hypothetical protein
LLLARQSRRQSSTDGTGLGWNIHQVGSGEQTWPLLWRASSTAGFSTFVGFRTDRQQALVLLGNTDADLSALGMAVLDSRPPPPLPPSRATPPTPARLGEYAGLYQVRSGTEITIRLRDDMLFAQVRGQPTARLYADGDDVFDTGAVGFSVSFQREAGKVNSLLLTRAGVNFVAQRLSDHAPHMARAAIATDARALDDYLGDYQLDTDVLARVSLRTGSLSLQTTGGVPVPLTPFAPGRFACVDESCVLTFHRDVAGNVTAMSVDFAGLQRDAPRVHWAVP